MEFPSTRGTRHGYPVDRCTRFAASPAHAARHDHAGSRLPHAAGLRSSRPVLRRVPRALARHRKLPDVLSVEEAGRLLEAAPGLKYKAALGVAYGAGLRVSEVAHLKVDDVDSARMLLRVEQGKGRKDRNAMLSP